MINATLSATPPSSPFPVAAPPCPQCIGCAECAPLLGREHSEGYGTTQAGVQTQQSHNLPSLLFPFL